MKPYTITLRILQVLAGVLCLIALISATTITRNSWPMTADWSSQGFSHFIELYRFPLLTLAALASVMALLLTTERLEQTDVQIRLLGENNRFNNYYRHRTAFVEAASIEEPFTFIHSGRAINAGPDPRIIEALYRACYCTHPLDFEPHINSRSTTLLSSFLKDVAESKLNQNTCSLSSLTPSDLTLNGTSLFDPAFQKIIELACRRRQEKTVGMIRSSGLEADLKNIRSSSFELLHTIYWLAVISRFVVSFDGGEVPDLTWLHKTYDICENNPLL